MNGRYVDDPSTLIGFALVAAHLAAKKGVDCYASGLGREVFQCALYQFLCESAQRERIQETLGVSWEWDGPYPTSLELYGALFYARTTIATGEFFLPLHKAVRMAVEDEGLFEGWRRELPGLLGDIVEEVAERITKIMKDAHQNGGSIAVKEV